MKNAATIFLTIFGGVFFLAGLSMFISGLSDIGASEEGDQWVLAVMGVIFAAAGGAVIFAGFRHRTEVNAIEEAKQRHPSSPWMWDRTWTSRRIEHHAGWTSFALWAFALFWNAFVVTAGVVGGADMAAQVAEEPAILLALAFPIVGIGLLIAAIRTTMQWRRFGTSALVLDRIPVSLGREFSGTLELPGDVREAEEVVASLRCLRTTKSGKNTSTTVVWNDEQRYPRSLMGSGPSGPTLAVRFRVPADEPETSVGSGYPSIRWEVDVSAAVAGVDFSASYRVPVFRTHDTPEPGSSSDETPPARGERSFGVVERTIVPERGVDGRSTWHFTPMRARAGAVFMVAFTGAWTAVMWVLITQDVPGFLLAVFGFFEIVLVMGTVDVLFGRVIVTVGRDGMLVRSGPAMFLSSRRLSRSDVLRFRVKASMTVGSTTYHAIEAMLKDGKTVTVGKYLRSRGEAEAIAEDYEKELKTGSGIGGDNEGTGT